MKLFFLRIVTFLAIPLGILCIWFPYIYFVNNKASANYKVKENVHSIIVGDSHAQHSIDDRLFPNSVNLSQTAESLVFTFYKIKTVLNNNPSIKKVYLGLGYHSFSSYFDDIVNNHPAEISSRYFLVLPYKEQKQILVKSGTDFPRVLMNVFSTGTKNLFRQKEAYYFMGGYVGATSEKPVTNESMDKRLNEVFYLDRKPRNFSIENVYYLEQIIELCKNEHVELILLNTPVHPYFKSKIPLKFVEKYNSIISEKHLKVIDFNNLVLTNSCFLPDGDHVSREGSIITTNRLNETENDSPIRKD